MHQQLLGPPRLSKRLTKSGQVSRSTSRKTISSISEIPVATAHRIGRRKLPDSTSPLGVDLGRRLAVGAVCCEPFSAAGYQVTGKITGNFFKSQLSLPMRTRSEADFSRFSETGGEIQNRESRVCEQGLLTSDLGRRSAQQGLPKSAQSCAAQTGVLPLQTRRKAPLAVRRASRHVTQFYDRTLASIGLRTTQLSVLAKLEEKKADNN